VNTTSWRKSSRSTGGNNSNCVEARKSEAVFQVRDSKLGESSPIFDLRSSEYQSLLRAAQR
jgi:hypothetical protein